MQRFLHHVKTLFQRSTSSCQITSNILQYENNVITVKRKQTSMTNSRLHKHFCSNFGSCSCLVKSDWCVEQRNFETDFILPISKREILNLTLSCQLLSWLKSNYFHECAVLNWIEINITVSSQETPKYDSILCSVSTRSFFKKCFMRNISSQHTVSKYFHTQISITLTFVFKP